MKILNYCNCLRIFFLKKEDIIYNKNLEIDNLKKEIKLLKIKINNLEYEISLKKNKNITYESYNIDNEFYYKSSEDIEEGYTVFE